MQSHVFFLPFFTCEITNLFEIKKKLNREIKIKRKLKVGSLLSTNVVEGQEVRVSIDPSMGILVGCFELSLVHIVK